MEENIKECCPEFNPALWQEKEHVWKDKLFVRDYVKQIFHIPINMGAVVTKMFADVEKAGASPKIEDFLMLAYDPSPWKSELYITVTKEVEGMENVKLSGKYTSKVYDGPFNNIPNWIKDFDIYLKNKNQKALKYYFYYTYCPKCAKKYGHNYVVAFAQTEE
ncbi:hypothetical protein M0R04_01405 [Candidatus Dojkabacteria bacterium]|jgi:hypothetical protein|nr:hypothetical protein [Candidatus Dojkabacteria bacterium]